MADNLRSTRDLLPINFLMPTPKAIFYDLDGTLRHSQPAGRDVFIAQAIQLGLTITDEDRRRSARWEHAYWARSAELATDLARFKEEDSDFWRNYSWRQLLALGCPQADAGDYVQPLHEHMNGNYRPCDLLFEGVFETLARLRERGYITAVVSNRDKPFHDYLAEKGILQHFDFSLAAGEVDSWKPSPEIFLHALQRAGVRPLEAVYIGDNYYADVVGARAVGLRPVLFDPAGIFPEADCPVLQTHAQIFELLERM